MFRTYGATHILSTPLICHCYASRDIVDDDTLLKRIVEAIIQPDRKPIRRCKQAYLAVQTLPHLAIC